MKTIKINEINLKPAYNEEGDQIVIVKYTLTGTPNNTVILEATMNTKWQAQQVNYLERDVGVGGTVSVMIEQKGKYTNITKVDLTSAKKEEMFTEKGVEMLKDVLGPSYEPSRDDKIVAQVFVKCATEIICTSIKAAADNNQNIEISSKNVGKTLREAVVELHGAYLVGLEKLR